MSTLEWTHTKAALPKNAEHPPGKREQKNKRVRSHHISLQFHLPGLGDKPKGSEGRTKRGTDNMFSGAAVFLGEEVCEQSHICSCREDLNLVQEMKLLLQTHQTGLLR